MILLLPLTLLAGIFVMVLAVSAAVNGMTLSELFDFYFNKKP